MPVLLQLPIFCDLGEWRILFYFYLLFHYGSYSSPYSNVLLTDEVDTMHRYSRCNYLIVSEIQVRKDETQKDLKRSFVKQMLKYLGIPKENFRLWVREGTQESIALRFRLYQFPWDLNYSFKIFTDGEQDQATARRQRRMLIIAWLNSVMLASMAM